MKKLSVLFAFILISISLTSCLGKDDGGNGSSKGGNFTLEGSGGN